MSVSKPMYTVFTTMRKPTPRVNHRWFVHRYARDRKDVASLQGSHAHMRHGFELVLAVRQLLRRPIGAATRRIRLLPLFAPVRAVVTVAVLAKVTAAHYRLKHLRILAWLRTLSGICAVVVRGVVLFLYEDMRVDMFGLSSHQGDNRHHRSAHHEWWQAEVDSQRKPLEP